MWHPTKTNNGWYPKLSPSGKRIVFGNWATWVSLNLSALGTEFEIPSPDGMRMHPAGWEDEDNIICHTEGGSANVYQINVTNGLVTPLNADGVANWSNAADGHWAMSRADRMWIIRDGMGFRPDIPQYGAVAMAGDYTVVARRDNWNIVVFKGDQIERELPTENKWSVSREGDVATGYFGRVNLYPVGSGHIDATLAPDGREGVPALLRVNGELWLWSQIESPLAVIGRRLGETEPIVLRDFPAVDVKVVWDGSNFIVAGNNTNGAMQVRTVPLDTPRESLTPKPNPNPIGDLMIRSFERPFWMAPFFSHSNRYGDTTDHTGNAIWIPCEETGRAIAFGMPLIVAVDTSQAFDPAALDLIIAWYVSGGDAAELQAKVEIALELPERPIIAYLDLGTVDAWPAERPEWITERVWPSVMAYRNAGEPLDIFSRRVTAMLDRVKSYGTVGMTLTPAFYTRNGTTSVEHITECMGLYEKWIRDYPIVCFMPFADMRPTGMAQHPEFKEWARVFEYAIPSSRPNRFDYWQPEGVDPLTILKNKLGQSRAAVVLEPYLRELILEEFETDPKPDPDPQPIEDGKLPDRVKQIVDQLYEKHKHLAHSSNDEDRRKLTKMIAEQTRFELGAQWGWKSAHASLQSPSKDAIAYVETGGIHGAKQDMMIWDLFNGATREPHEDPHGEKTSQYFIAEPMITPQNHLGA